MSWIAQVAETPLMPDFWMLGSTGALLTHVLNAVSEAQPSFLARPGRSIGARMSVHPLWHPEQVFGARGGASLLLDRVPELVVLLH
jgi:hypothetical protein